MDQEETTANSSIKPLAANKKENLQMDLNTLNEELKSTIVEAALDEFISYKMAEEFIEALGYRGI